MDYASHGNITDRIYKVADMFASIGWHNFSLTEIAMLVYNKEWDSNPEKKISYASDRISLMYPVESRVYEGFQLPAIHLLRITTGNYRGNLHRTKGYEIVDGKLEKAEEAPYPNVRISADDWREGITLPLPLKTETGWVKHFNSQAMELLGCIWGLGFLWETRYKTGNKKALCLTFTYKQEDVIKDVKKLCKVEFNFEPTIQSLGDKPSRKNR